MGIVGRSTEPCLVFLTGFPPLPAASTGVVYRDGVIRCVPVEKSQKIRQAKHWLALEH